jgi:DNA (cytosine-5)-methyltransferase 1
MGYKLAGCSVVAANDIDPEMAWHYQRNIAPARFFLSPIRALVDGDVPAELSDLDILDGSPPCSTFSMSGNREKDWGKDKMFREGQAKQVLSDLFFDFIDLAGKLRPKVIVAENVKGMLVGNAKGYTRMVVRRMEEIGYRVQVFLLNAADFGVPQRRERVFFVASRADLAMPLLVLPPKTKWTSVGEATSDLQCLTEEEREQTRFTSKTDLEWWHKTNPGEKYEDATVREGQKPKLWNHKKLHKNKPSNTLTSAIVVNGGITHWSEPRSLTLREVLRIGGFPDDYVSKSDKLGKYIVGMSVAPAVTAALATAMQQQWFRNAR